MIVSDGKKNKLSKRYPLIFAATISFLTVLSAGVSTFAWFQAEAQVRIETSSNSATITVSKPEEAKFYYFKGNGNPASLSTNVGYSKSGATVGTDSNVVNVSNGTVQTAEIASASAITFADHFAEITEEGNFTSAKCFDLSRIRPGCYYTYCVSYKTSTAITLKLGEFTQLIQGSDLTPKRYLGTTGTVSLSLAQIINSTSYSVAPANENALNSSAVNYIKKTLGEDVSLSGFTGDAISYDGSTGTGTSGDFTLHSKASGSDATYYVFFSIYMESDKTNALAFNSKSGSGANEVYRYTKSNTGTYSPYDGLSIRLSSISIS